MKSKKTPFNNRFLALSSIASLITVGCTAVQAADWVGDTSTDWNDPLNWAGDTLPATTAIQSATGNIATISANSAFSPSEIVIGGWWATGRLDHTAGTASTANAGWPPGWMLVGFGPQGNATYNLANTAATGGSFTGYGTGSGTMTVVNSLYFGEPGGGNGNGVATANINTTGALSVTNDIHLGVSGWTGNMNVDAGTVTATNINIGKTVSGSTTSGVGDFKMSGGTVTTTSRINIGVGDNAVAAGSNVGTVTMTGGILRTDDATANFWGAGVNMASGVWDGVNGSGLGGSGGTATFNLDGGTLSTHWVFSENRVDNMGTPENTADDVAYAKGTSTFNFNGGTLQAQETRDVPWLPFMGNLTNAYVKAGGAVIDSNGVNIMITQALLADGVSAGGGLTKKGAGNLILGGANTYTGLTTIEGGTLTLNDTGTINNTSGVSLGAAGTLDVSEKGGYTVSKLSGQGNVIGALTVSSELAIGNSPGTTDFSSNLTLGSASTYTYELTGGGVSADLGNVGGSLTISAGAILDLVQLGTYTLGEKFTLFAYDGTLSGAFNGLADDSVFTDVGGDWRINYNDTSAGLNGGTGSSFVTITAVPEPGAALLGGIGMLMLFRRRRG